MRKQRIFQNPLKRRQRGAALIEYVLLVALIAMAGVVAIKKGGEGVKGKAEHIQAAMTAVGAGDVQCNPGDSGYPNDC